MFEIMLNVTFLFWGGDHSTRLHFSCFAFLGCAAAESPVGTPQPLYPSQPDDFTPPPAAPKKAPHFCLQPYLPSPPQASVVLALGSGSQMAASMVLIAATATTVPPVRRDVARRGAHREMQQGIEELLQVVYTERPEWFLSVGLHGLHQQ